MGSRRNLKSAAIPQVTRAEVVSVVDEDTVLIRFHRAPAEELFRAELGIHGYEPQSGDRVVVSAEERDFIVLGVLGDARRRTRSSAESLVSLRREGNHVELSVPDGALVLTARDGISVTGPDVHVTAGRLELHAHRLIERTEETYRRTEGLVETTAGRSRTVVSGSSELQSARTVIVSDEDTVIDGKRVLVG